MRETFKAGNRSYLLSSPCDDGEFDRIVALDAEIHGEGIAFPAACFPATF
ncbi:MAG: hypothetical protein NT080_12790 [Spirochaetes bacterium]|nr:hypothetical protein [Spirochaetota bacterium]